MGIAGFSKKRLAGGIVVILMRGLRKMHAQRLHTDQKPLEVAENTDSA